MAFTGVQSEITSVTNLAANQMPDIDKYLYLLEPYQTPLLQHLYFNNSVRGEAVVDEKGYFQWFEDEYQPHQTTAAADISLGTSATVAVTWASLTNPTYFNVGDTVLIESTEEMAYVSAISSSTSVTFAKFTGNFGGGTVSSGKYIKIIGSRNSEYATARTPILTKEVQKSNYLSIFSETVTSTGRAQAGQHYTNGRGHKDQVRKKTLEMKKQFERNFLFATENGSSSSGNYSFTWGKGFLGQVTTNKVSYSGVLPEAAFDDYLQQVFTSKGSSNSKLHLCGADHLAAINKIVKDKYQINPVISGQYGVRVVSYIVPFGQLKLVWNPLMDGKFSHYGFTIDEKNGMKLRYMANDDKGSRKFRVEENVQTPGTDGISTKLLADIGLQVPNEEQNGILYNSAV